MLEFSTQLQSNGGTFGAGAVVQERGQYGSRPQKSDGHNYGGRHEINAYLRKSHGSFRSTCMARKELRTYCALGRLPGSTTLIESASFGLDELLLPFERDPQCNQLSERPR